MPREAAEDLLTRRRLMVYRQAWSSSYLALIPGSPAQVQIGRVRALVQGSRDMQSSDGYHERSGLRVRIAGACAKPEEGYEMSTQPGSETITLELPARLLAGYPGTRQEFVQNLRLAAAIEWFREGKISQGKGAEIAGVSRWEFLLALGRAQVDLFQGTAEELTEEVQRRLETYRQHLAAYPPEQDRSS
jgi:predicted HTH domain antitoxin